MIEIIRTSDRVIEYSFIRIGQSLWHLCFDHEYYVDFSYEIVQGIDPGKYRICHQNHQLVSNIKVSFDQAPCTITFDARVLTSKGGYAILRFTVRPERHVFGFPGDPDYPDRLHFGEFSIFRLSPKEEKSDLYLWRFFDQNLGALSVIPIPTR